MKNLEKFSLSNKSSQSIKGGVIKDSKATYVNCCPDVIDPNLISSPSNSKNK